MPGLASFRAAVFGLLVVCLAACGGPRDARPGGPSPMEFERFEAADLDRDGKLNREEFAAVAPEVAPRFDRIDTDRSGYLSWNEVRAARYPVIREPRYIR